MLTRVLSFLSFLSALAIIWLVLLGVVSDSQNGISWYFIFFIVFGLVAASLSKNQ